MERLKDILSNLGPAGDRVEVLEGIKPALSALSRKDMEVLDVRVLLRVLDPHIFLWTRNPGRVLEL